MPIPGSVRSFSSSNSSSSSSSSRSSLLQLYKQLLRACETYPSKKRADIYQAIREEWRANKDLGKHKEQQQQQQQTQQQQEQAEKKLQQQIAVAYKGLSQLQQFSIQQMSGGRGEHSPHWSVTLEQNPMPKPADWDERQKKKKLQQQENNNDDDGQEER